MKQLVPISYKVLGILFIFMMIMPFKYQIFKLSLCLFCILYASIKKISFTNQTLKKWTFLYVGCNLIAFLIGVLYNNPGYQYYVNTYFLWPILYYLIFRSIDINFYPFFHKYLKIGVWFVLILGLFSFTYYNLNGLVREDILSVEPSVRPGLPFIAISDGCVNSIIFLYSYFIVYSLLNRENNIFLLMTCFVFVFITSKRVIYLELFIAIIEYLLLKKICKIPINKKIMTLFFVLAIVFIIAAVGVIQHFSFFYLSDIFSFFDEVSDASDSYRIDQYNSLILGWKNNPIFGNGTGVDAKVVRSAIPGTYELSYVAMLFERGIVGITFYMIILLTLNMKSIKVLKKYPISRKYLLPLLVAVDMMLIANATNNYTQAFDYAWMFFIVFPFLKTKSYEKYLHSNTSL